MRPCRDNRKMSRSIDQLPWKRNVMLCFSSCLIQSPSTVAGDCSFHAPSHAFYSTRRAWRERERERERETDEIDAAKPGGLWNSATLWHCKHTKQQQRLSSVTTWNPRRWEIFSIYCFEKLTQWLRTFFLLLHFLSLASCFIFSVLPLSSFSSFFYIFLFFLYFIFFFSFIIF